MSDGDSEHGGADQARPGSEALDPSARVRDLIGRARNLNGGLEEALAAAPRFAPEDIVPLVDEFRQEASAEPLDLGERDRLPWLESEEDEDTGVDTGRVAIAVGAGLALMASIVGGVWYVSHRKDAGAPVADGSLIAAPAEPWREAPKEPGGKQFDGTGDTSYAVSQGQNRPAQLAGGDAEVPKAGASFAGGAAEPAAAADKPAAKPAEAAPAGAPAGPVGGVVQIAAYASQTQAEGGWNRLVVAHEMLKGMNHRIVAAKIELATVYRLQIVTNAGGGQGLCERLKADGVSCQVKH